MCVCGGGGCRGMSERGRGRDRRKDRRTEMEQKDRGKYDRQKKVDEKARQTVRHTETRGGTETDKDIEIPRWFLSPSLDLIKGREGDAPLPAEQGHCP